jgi:hypothetical protein
MYEGKTKEGELFNMFELKKDINTPDYYHRAGTKATKEEWEKIFPKAFQFGGTNDEWFIDLSIKKDDTEQKEELVWNVVNDVFNRNGLHSISYKEAAVKSCQEYLRKAKALENK